MIYKLNPSVKIDNMLSSTERKTKEQNKVDSKLFHLMLLNQIEATKQIPPATTK